MTIASDLVFHAFPQKQSLITRILFPAIKSRVLNPNQFEKDFAGNIIENIIFKTLIWFEIIFERSSEMRLYKVSQSYRKVF